MQTDNKRLVKTILLLEALLLIPFLGMQFSSEVNWSSSDFILMGFMLLTLSILIETVLRLIKKQTSRILFIGISILLFLIIWTELAVGLFGSPFAGS